MKRLAPTRAGGCTRSGLDLAFRLTLMLGWGGIGLVAVPLPEARAQAGPSEHRTVSYRLDIAPLLSRAGCNAGPCHGNLNGKGGLKLSLRGDGPAEDWFSLTHDSQSRRLNRFEPESSLLLQKPAGLTAHEGGQRFLRGSSEYRLLRDWIGQGAIDDGPTAPRVTRLIVEPASRLIQAAETGDDSSDGMPRYVQPLSVRAELSDGTTRDVTAACTYELNDPTRADISPDGRVTSQRPGEVAVSIRYLQARATSRLAFLANRPGFTWRGPEPTGPIDEHVFHRLKQLNIQAAPPASDPVFLRRVYLDVIGTLPTPDEVRAFEADTAPDRRARLVDRLLDRTEFADFWALKWADILRNEEKAMGAKGVHAFQRWLRDHFSADTPLDTIATQLLTARGSTWRNPAASFYRTNRDPMTCAETVGQVFLGVRMQCARCHNHPFDVWTQDDYYGLAASFANIQRKQIDNVRRDKFDTHEINGDEVIYLAGRPQLANPRSGTMMTPRPPGEVPLALPDSDRDALDDLASHLTRDNRQFARAQANRIWFHLMGRGIVDPVDDFRESNPASNPALLESLTDQFLAGQMRLKPLVRAIVLSQTYQLDAATEESNADDESHFSHAIVKLLPAEVLLDAVHHALGYQHGLAGAPGADRAVQIAGSSKGSASAFLKTFGKPERLLTCECERSDGTTLGQAFQLINGPIVRQAIEANDNRMSTWLDARPEDDGLIDELYLATLARKPGASERSAALEHVHAAENRRKGWEDVAWALLNSKEFLLRH